jgi:hypothetical protein
MNPLTVFTGPYALLAKWGVIVALVGIFGAFCWFKGNAHGTAKLTAYQGAQAIESVKVITRQGVVTERIVVEYRDRVKVREGATTTIEREVTKYVESKPLTLACNLDLRWMRLHDAAAAGTVPPPASGTDAAPGTVTAAAALPTVTANYAACGRNADRLDLLQAWVRGQYEATNGTPLRW